MTNKISEKHIDSRTVARYLDKGTVSEKDFEKYIKALPDLTENAEAVELEQPANDTTPSL